MDGLVQLHAWELDTHNGDEMAEVVAGRGVFPWEMTQLQHLQIQIEVQARYLREAVGTRQSDGVLPVFLAPQFVFTSQGNRPYDRGTIYKALPYLEQISRTYPHVLWCPGTVWWQERMLDQRSIQYRVHNTTLVYQGGRLLLNLQKTLLSEHDPLDIAAPARWDQDDPASVRRAASRHQPFCKARMPRTQDVVTVGVEVGNTHVSSWNRTTGLASSYGDLRTRYASGQRGDPADHGVDLHVLIGNGMPIHANNVAARDGGLVLRVDGGENIHPRSQVGSVRRSGQDPAGALKAWDPQIDYQPATFRGDDLANRLAVFPPTPLR